MSRLVLNFLVQTLFSFTIINFVSAATQPKAGAEIKTQIQTAQGKSIDIRNRIITFPQIDCKEGLYLRKTRAEYTLNFAFPQNWHAQPGSALVLNLSHSPALVPRMSNLSVEINSVPVKTIVLDDENIQPADLVIPVDKVPLREYNHLVFKVAQHYAVDCEDDLSSALWTRIGPTSRLVFVLKLDRLSLDLQNWPYPIVDIKTSYKEKVHFALPTAPHLETLRAMARVAADLGNLSNYQAIELTGNGDTTSNTIIVGTPAENHAIADLAAKLPLPVNQLGHFLDENGKEIPPDWGVLELASNSNGQICLVVSGDTPAAVESAAIALTNATLNPICGGQAAIIEKIELPQSSTNASNLRPGQMPEQKSFTLAEIGYPTTTVHGYCPEGISVNCDSIPGIEAVGNSQKLRVVFGYGAQMNTDLSSLEIRLNGSTLRSYALEKTQGEERHEDLVSIPNYLINPENHFEFIFHLYPKQFSRCAPKNDEHLWGTLYEETRLIIDREYVTSLPDLSLLNHSGFPFTRNNALSNLVFVVPGRTDAATTMALLNLSLLFGQWVDNAQSNLRVAFDNALDKDARNSSNLIVLSPGGATAVQKELADMLTLNNSESLVKALSASDGRKLTVREREANGYLEEIPSPWSKGKAVLILSGKSPQGFALAAAGITDSQLRYKLRGSLASVSAEGMVKSVQSTPVTTSTTMTLGRQIILWLSEYVWLSPLILFILLALLIPRFLNAIKPERS